MTDRFLSRFRADPKKVRVSVRRCTGPGTWRGRTEWWYASIGNCQAGIFVGSPGTTPVRAVVQALGLAEERNMPGIDLGMGWAYDHPQGPLAPSDRACRITETVLSPSEGDPK